jgi:hypothetical protein
MSYDADSKAEAMKKVNRFEGIILMKIWLSAWRCHAGA